MKKIKVRVYKDPNGQGSYVNKAAQFLQKAAYGTEVKGVLADIDNYILDELVSGSDDSTIAMTIQDKYGLNYYAALDRVDEMKSIYDQSEENKKTVEMIPTEEPEINNDNNTGFGERYQYPTVGEPSLALDEEGWAWDDVDPIQQEDILESGYSGPGEYTMTEKKQGGSMPKHKFVNKVVKGLRKAAEGTEQEESNQASINDIPVGGRNQLVSNFRRGMKDLGNEHYAKQIYDMTQQQKMMGMAEGGIQQQETDPENPMHHLHEFALAQNQIMPNQMNQVDQVGEDVPEARYGRRMMRKAAREWDRMFGDIPVGMFGPGVPNYLGYIVPRENPGVLPTGDMQSYLSGMGVKYTRRPFKRTMEITNIPFYMPPTGYPGSMQSSYEYPGEVYYREKVVQPETTEEKKQFGGPTMNPQPDSYGQLQKFVAGGNDMPVSSYNAYAENDVNTKDVTDPFYKDGGSLYRFDGENNSQVNQFTPITTQEQLDAYLANQKKDWELNWYKNAYSQGQQGMYPQTAYSTGYSNNPWKNFRDTFRVFNQGPTGRNYDFMWLSQNGPMTQDGKPYQPTTQGSGSMQPEGANTFGIGEGDSKRYVTDAQAQAYSKAKQLNPNLTVDQFLQTSGTGNQPFGMQFDPTKAGYRPNIKTTNRLFGKDTADITWNWYDPANQNTGTTDQNTAGAQPNMSGTGAENQTVNDYSYLSNRAQRQIKHGEKSQQRNAARFARNPEGNINPLFYNKAATSNKLSNVVEKPIVQSPPVQAYGGVPHFQGTAESQVAFDPNANQQAIDPNYHPTFHTQYDIHKARTLNTKGINNIKNAAMYAAIGFNDAKQNQYQDMYLAANTTSDNRKPANELRDPGSFSGLNQRRIADPNNNPYFNGVVGKTGGTMQYKKGGVYDLTQEEIGAILAAGGTIEFM